MNSRLSSLVRTADDLFRELVRLDSNHCVTCHRRDTLEVGHIKSRKYYGTRWYKPNGHRQCRECNIRHESDMKAERYKGTFYDKWFVNRYGQDAYDDLEIRAFAVYKLTEARLEQVIKRLREKIRKAKENA